jgi:hypothetical protein
MSSASITFTSPRVGLALALALQALVALGA